MACNCGKNQKTAAQPRTYNGSPSQGNRQSFSLILRDGSKQTFGSRLEADAANARAGYSGVVKPVGG